jgi:hypothetical protein
MRGSMMSFCFRTASLAIASTAFMAGAQQSGTFRVSDNTAGGTANWFEPPFFDSGDVEAEQVTDAATNSPATFMTFLVSKSNVFVFVQCFAPASALSSKTFSSVSFQVADISTCDGGRITHEFAEDCTSGITCIDIPIPHWSVSAAWTKRGVRTLQRSGTTKTVGQDPFSGKILASSQTSGIETFYDAPFAVDVNGDSISGLGSIFFSKGVTISFSPN